MPSNLKDPLTEVERSDLVFVTAILSPSTGRVTREQGLAHT
jgi:hypothetical protein